MRDGRSIAPNAWDGEDSERPLLEDGKRRTKAMARHMAEAAIIPGRILTSPMLRAVQTAQIVAKALGCEPPVEDPRLAGGFDVVFLSRILAENDDVTRLLLVGHEPGLSTVLSELIGGGTVDFRKGAVARVDLAYGQPRGELVWLLTPGSLGL
jgi:phosphohistidine phosphatase